jgi:hypothetical protein
MVNLQNSSALDGSLIRDLFDLDDYHIGNPEDMPFDELERLFEDQSSQSSFELSSDHLVPSSHNAPPNSSASPGNTDIQLTPSSTADELPPDENNLDEFPVDLGTEYTSSPNEVFEHISPYSSRSDDYLYVNSSLPHSVTGASPFPHGSRESTSGLVSDLTQQQWPSFDTLASDSIASDTRDQLGTLQYPGFNDAAAASTGALASENLFGTTLPLRPAQHSSPWVPTGVQSNTFGHSWGRFYDQSTYLQNDPPAHYISPSMPAQPHHNPQQSQTYYAGSFPAAPLMPYHPINSTTQQSRQPHVHQDGMQRQAGARVSATPQVSNGPAHLSVSTRYRYRHRPAIIAEQQSPTSSRQKPKNIAVLNVDDIPMTARPRDPQSNKRKQGGRKPNTHLNQDARERSSRMRKKGACWRCKLQRDPVSHHKPQLWESLTDMISVLTMAHLVPDVSSDHRKVNCISSVVTDLSCQILYTTFYRHRTLSCTRSKILRIA